VVQIKAVKNDDLLPLWGLVENKGFSRSVVLPSRPYAAGKTSTLNPELWILNPEPWTETPTPEPLNHESKP